MRTRRTEKREPNFALDETNIGTHMITIAIKKQEQNGKQIVLKQNQKNNIVVHKIGIAITEKKSNNGNQIWFERKPTLSSI